MWAPKLLGIDEGHDLAVIVAASAVSGSHAREPNEIAPPARHRFGTDNGHAWVDPLRTPRPNDEPNSATASA
jgi:hypothetical protein